MSKFDKEYLTLCKKILTDGVNVSNRTGINTTKLPAYFFSFDLEEEFPILTTKQVFIRQAVLEMLWIYQAKSNDVRWLQDRNVHIWDKWMIDEDGIYRTYDNNNNIEVNPEKKVYIKNLDDKIMTDVLGNPVMTKGLDSKSEIIGAKYFGKDAAFTIGTAYGYIVNKMNLIDNLIDTLKNNPTDRRMIMSLWQNDYLKTAVLPSCVWSSEWDVTNGKLNAFVHQRSCDVPLGLPFNITQYAVLLHMLAQVTNLKPGTLSWSIKDAHIYDNQINMIKEQIRRYDELGDFEAPEFWLNPDVKEFYQFDNSKECKDVKIKNYKHRGKIDIPLTQ